MNILVLGGGGREHALAWKAAQSAGVERVFVAPGNAGSALEDGLENIAIDIGDAAAQVRFARDNHVALTIVGPEAPLVDGVVDAFNDAGLACFGPTRAAARLEGSKTFAKEFLKRHEIPTAAYSSFTEPQPAIDFLERVGLPCVIKADGLAAGKGVVIAQTHGQARDAITGMLSAGRFGSAGHRVVVEEFLEGEEASFMCLVDGRSLLSMATSQDHKAAHDGDTGPNTGGMGAYSPAPVIDEAMHRTVIDTIIRPTVSGMAADGIPYSGFLYAGLMVGRDGVPRVLEFNCRMGDPETQPIMMRLRSDLVQHCLAAVRGELDTQRAEWDPRPALGVVMAAHGYPQSVRTGDVISGLAPGRDEQDESVRVFHAGAAMKDGEVVTSGGRVLCVTALGEDVAEAQSKAYRRARDIEWDGAWRRSDIGHRAINRR